MSLNQKQYPSHGDYDVAVQYISKFVSDPVLATGKPIKLKNGSGLLSYPGGFAKAYKVDVGNRTYALRVWLSEIGNAADRYAAIADYFRRNPLKYVVQDFHFLPNGILVNGSRYPTLRMEWVSGQSLGDFITSHLGEPEVLRSAALAFLEMVRALHAAQVAHGDLQSENMVVGVSGKSVWIKLIDYDTLVVPALVGKALSSIGLQSYQHPKREQSQKATLHDDYFSELVIYLSLLAVAEDPDLWRRFPNNREKELLFLPEDFTAPTPPPVFQRLYKMGHTVRSLAVSLWNFTRLPSIDRLTPLEVVVTQAQAGSQPKSPPPPPIPRAGSFDLMVKAMLKANPEGVTQQQPTHFDDSAFRTPPQAEAQPPGPKASNIRTTSKAATPLRMEGTKPGEEREFDLVAGVKIRMCWIPSGTFWMGSTPSEPERDANETFAEVSLSRGFWMAKHPCTQVAWRAVMGANPSAVAGEILPVEQVSWHDCQRYLDRLTGPSNGWTYRLPTEAQWEYACRAQTFGPYSGDLENVAWYNRNSGLRTHIVGGKRPNAWGLQDMHGNVWEWCRDAYQKHPTTGKDPLTAKGPDRVARGGSWCNEPRRVRSASRVGFAPDYRSAALGFRLALCPNK